MTNKTKIKRQKSKRKVLDFRLQGKAQLNLPVTVFDLLETGLRLTLDLLEACPRLEREGEHCGIV
jgi:hypothetical protein